MQRAPLPSPPKSGFISEEIPGGRPAGPYLVIVGAQVTAQQADGRPRRPRHGASMGPVPPQPGPLSPTRLCPPSARPCSVRPQPGPLSPAPSARPVPASPPRFPLSLLPPGRSRPAPGCLRPPPTASLRARGAGRSRFASREGGGSGTIPQRRRSGLCGRRGGGGAGGAFPLAFPWQPLTRALPSPVTLIAGFVVCLLFWICFVFVFFLTSVISLSST